MFEREMSRTDWMLMVGLSLAMTVPFVFILKNMSDSLEIIAHKR